MYTQYFQMPGCGDHLKLEGLLCHGVWTPGQYHLHINILALKQFHEILSNSSVMIAADSASVVASVVAYTREEGGTHSPKLCMEVWETLNSLVPKEGNISKSRTYSWEIQHSCRQTIKDVKTNINRMVPESDYMQFNFSEEGTSKHRSFHNMSQQKKLLLYMSPIPDNQDLAIEALSMNWDRMHAYAFPHPLFT